MFLERLERVSGSARYALVGALCVAIAAADLFTGYEYTLAALYLVPIAVAGWVSSRRAALALAAGCAIFWFALNYPAESGSHLSVAVWNGGLRAVLFLLTAFAVSAARAILENERRLSRTDYTTGAMNARAFYEVCERELERANRYGSPFSLIVLDVDDFKRINDQLGHRAGDDVLRAVAALMREALRKTDTIARVGGDEFAALLPQTAEREAAVAVERLMVRRTHGATRDVTVSAGVVTCLTPPESVDAALSFADHLMYAAKKAGKNRYVADIFNTEGKRPKAEGRVAG